MSGKSEYSGFTLNVPVDACSIGADSEAQDVRVAVQMQDGSFESQTVTVQPGRSETARFEFDEAPGGIRILLGPAKASAEELAKLQTIAVDVPGHRMQEREHSIAPVVVSKYFWWWWRSWCREFVDPRRGRLRRRQPGARRDGLGLRHRLVLLVEQQAGDRQRDHRRRRGLRDPLHLVLRVLAVVVVAQPCVGVRQPARANVQAVIERDPGLKLARTTLQPSLSAFARSSRPTAASAKLRAARPA